MEDSQGIGALWWPKWNCRRLPGLLLNQGKKHPFSGPLPQWQSQPPLRPTTRSSISAAGTSVRHASQSLVIFQTFPLLMAHPKDLVLLFLGDKRQASSELRSGSAPPRSLGIPGSGSLGSLLLSYVQMLVVHSALLGQAHLSVIPGPSCRTTHCGYCPEHSPQAPRPFRIGARGHPTALLGTL